MVTCNFLPSLILFFPLLDNNVASRGGVFLVPMHGGIWTMCVDLTDDELRILGKHGFPRAAKCLNYLAVATAEQELVNRDWQHAETLHPLHPQISKADPRPETEILR